jgi:uncharacterized protein YjbI with pentapeptide repeats
MYGLSNLVTGKEWTGIYAGPFLWQSYKNVMIVLNFVCATSTNGVYFVSRFLCALTDHSFPHVTPPYVDPSLCIQNCELVGSDLQHANLRGANITGTNLQGIII